MSTGDQTQYIRGKLAERGVSQGVKFMKDGFDLWAESTAPARVGEMEKEPAEMTNMEGGRMTLHMAKRFQHRRGGAEAEYIAEEVDYSPAKLAMKMRGGALPKIVEDGINFGRQLVDVYKKVSAWVDEFQQDLQDEVIDNPSASASLKDFATKLKQYLSTMMAYKSIVDEIVKVTGAGKRKGGDLASTIATATEYAKKIISVAMWFRNNAKNIRLVLSMKSLNVGPGLGKQLLAAIDPFLSVVSIGAALPKVNYSMAGAGHTCGCDSGSEEEMCGGRRPKRKGRAKPMTAKEIEDAVKKALAEPKEGKISSHVSALVEKAKKLEARRKRTTGGAWYDDVASAFSPQTYASQVSELPEKIMSAGRKHKRKGGVELYYPPPAGGARTGEMHSGLSSDIARRVGGKKAEHMMPDGSIMPGATHGGRKKRAPSARGAIVSKVMREMKMSLPQASKYVKEKGLF